MIEKVSLNQEYFLVPTLRLDSRGVVLGERGAVLFGMISEVVTFFKILSQEKNLDQISHSLKIWILKGRTRGSSLLVDLLPQNSFFMDRVAQIARLMKAQVYVGKYPHFVTYRDHKSPCGYDTDELQTWDDGPIFYEAHGDSLFEQKGERSFSALILGLSLEKSKSIGRASSQNTARFILARGGLNGAVQSFLFRRGISAKVVQLRPKSKGYSDREKIFYLFQTPKLPLSVFQLFSDLPGIEIYRQAGENIFVESSWRHPFTLENCQKFFSEQQLYLFSGKRACVDSVALEKLNWVDIQHLKASSVQVNRCTELQGDQALPESVDWLVDPVDELLNYKVCLSINSNGQDQATTARLLKSELELRWLKKIVFTLPQTALEDYQVAFTNCGALVRSRRGVGLIPIGIPLKEHFLNVYLPVNMGFSPSIKEKQFKEIFSPRAGVIHIFSGPSDPPFSILSTQFCGFSKFLFSDVQMEEAHNLIKTPPPSRESGGELQSDKVPYFALWYQNYFKKTATPAPTTPKKIPNLKPRK